MAAGGEGGEGQDVPFFGAEGGGGEGGLEGVEEGEGFLFGGGCEGHFGGLKGLLLVGGLDWDWGC